MDKIRTTQNKAVRLISGADYNDHVEPLYKKLNLLNLDEIFLSQYAALMYDQDHDTLPRCFDNYFRQVKEIHSHQTRMADSNKLSENVKINTITYGKTKQYFRRKYKAYLIKLEK